MNTPTPAKAEPLVRFSFQVTLGVLLQLRLTGPLQKVPCCVLRSTLRVSVRVATPTVPTARTAQSRQASPEHVAGLDTAVTTTLPRPRLKLLPMPVQAAFVTVPLLTSAVVYAPWPVSSPLSARKNAAVLSAWRWPSMTLAPLTFSIWLSAKITVAIRKSTTTAVTMPR